MLDMVDDFCLHFSTYHQVKHSRIDASILKGKANALDSLHPLCRNLIVDLPVFFLNGKSKTSPTASLFHDSLLRCDV